jgi:hypothetical protein
MSVLSEPHIRPRASSEAYLWSAIAASGWLSALDSDSSDVDPYLLNGALIEGYRHDDHAAHTGGEAGRT